MTISVIEVDINHGNVGDCFSCPVANAIQRAFPDATEIIVDAFSACIDGSVYLFGERTRQRIEAFDKNGRMEPFEFPLYPTDAQRC